MTRSLPALLRAISLALALLGLGALAGCVYYPPPVSTFDRSYDAALGAIADQGLPITSQDRAAGHIVGARGALTVTASVRPQADGTTRVEFSTRGDTGADANISQRVTSAYHARMGR